MRYRKIGRTGLEVSELCLGTMTFGGSGPLWKAIGALGEKETRAMIGRALEAGVNFFDTANGYGDGESETLLGKGLGARRREVVIVTKFGFPQGTGRNDGGASRVHVLRAVEESLRRLGTDWIDIYMVHRRDPGTSLDETLRALDDLIRAGKIRYAGISNHPAWQIAAANARAEARDSARFECVQAYYALAARDIEREIVPYLRAEGVGLMVWSPLAGGLLTGKYRPGAQPDADTRRAGFDLFPTDWGRLDRTLAAMQTIAQSRGASLAQIALAWLLAKEHVTSVIVGAKRMEQLDDNLKAVDMSLAAEDLARLDEASALPVEYPGWYLERFDNL